MTSSADGRPETKIHVSGVPVVVKGLPAEAAEWTFTKHAADRIAQRHLNVIAVLRAVCAPTTTRGGGRLNVEIRERGGLKVIITLDTKEILSVVRQGVGGP